MNPFGAVKTLPFGAPAGAANAFGAAGNAFGAAIPTGVAHNAHNAVFAAASAFGSSGAPAFGAFPASAGGFGFQLGTGNAFGNKPFGQARQVQHQGRR